MWYLCIGKTNPHFRQEGDLLVPNAVMEIEIRDTSTLPSPFRRRLISWLTGGHISFRMTEYVNSILKEHS